MNGLLAGNSADVAVEDQAAIEGAVVEQQMQQTTAVEQQMQQQQVAVQTNNQVAAQQTSSELVTIGEQPEGVQVSVEDLGFGSFRMVKIQTGQFMIDSDTEWGKGEVLVKVLGNTKQKLVSPESDRNKDKSLVGYFPALDDLRGIKNSKGVLYEDLVANIEAAGESVQEKTYMMVTAQVMKPSKALTPGVVQIGDVLVFQVAPNSVARANGVFFQMKQSGIAPNDVAVFLGVGKSQDHGSGSYNPMTCRTAGSASVIVEKTGICLDTPEITAEFLDDF